MRFMQEKLIEMRDAANNKCEAQELFFQSQKNEIAAVNDLVKILMGKLNDKTGSVMVHETRVVDEQRAII
jgi:hypothetical protein